MLCLATLVPSCEEGEGGGESSSSTIVCVTLLSHNERTLSRFGKYRENYADYLAFRAKLLEIATLIHDHGLRYSWQTDYVILEAIDRHEADALAADPAPTAGKPILLYLSEDLGVSIEAHAHESQNDEPGRFLEPPNYADLVYMIEEISGIAPPPVIGGGAEGERTIAELAAGIEGNVYPTTFFPEILSGFVYASGHGPGADSTLSGVWRPTELTESLYGVHDEDGPIVAIGTGNSFGQFGGALGAEKPIDFIHALVEAVESGEATPGRIYTAGIIFPVDRMLEEDWDDDFLALLEDLRTLAEAGRIVPTTHPEVVAIWTSQFGQEANVYEAP